MVLCGWQRQEYAIRERRSRRFPTLFNRIEFWSICRKTFQAECLAVSTTELTNKSALVRRTVIDKEQYATPSLQGTLKEPDKLSLSFALAECVHEPSSGSRPEDVRANVLVIDQHRGIAAAARPSTCDNGNQAESCFVLGSDDETSSFVCPRQSSRFFLNAAIVAASALR